jgi:hypothetical protein
MIQKYGEENIDKHFRFFDTICGATQDRQDALEKLLREPMNLLIVIGGYNSSNTSHLAEMGEAKLPTYFIKNAAKMVSDKLIPLRPAQKAGKWRRATGCPPAKSPSASPPARACPNNLIEDTIRRLFELRGISVQELLAVQQNFVKQLSRILPCRARARNWNKSNGRSRALRAVQRRHARPRIRRTAARMAHPIPARPRPRHPFARLPPARIQDAGFSQRHRRPSPHAAHAHDGSRRHLAQHRQRAPAEHRPGRNHRARARPRPFAVRPQGRNVLAN